MLRLPTIALTAALVIVASGCGGGLGGGNGDPPPSKGGTGGTSVVVAPSGIGQVWQGTTVQFTAHVSGQSSQAVTWSVEEAARGV